MARLAWFSPMPPVRSGVAACSAELVAALDEQHDDRRVRRRAAGGLARQTARVRRTSSSGGTGSDPYDLTVYQVGNSSNHDYLWPYLFRFPGTRRAARRPAASCARGVPAPTRATPTYRAEFIANHPDGRSGSRRARGRRLRYAALLLLADDRLIAQASRLGRGPHARRCRRLCSWRSPRLLIRPRFASATARRCPTMRQQSRADARAEPARPFPSDALVFGCFGGLTPEKRITQILKAFAATWPTRQGAPPARGRLARHDVDAQSRRPSARPGDHGRSLTGYLDSERALTDCIAACDAYPEPAVADRGRSVRPVAPCLALGLPTVIVDLAHLADVPSLDPRTWQPHGGSNERGARCASRSTSSTKTTRSALAMRRLATQPALRERLGRAAADYWRREHAPEHMVEDYLRADRRALHRDDPAPSRCPPTCWTTAVDVLDGDRRSVRRPTALEVDREDTTERRPVRDSPARCPSPRCSPHLNIDPRRVAVEHNLDIIKRARYDTTMINEGDEVEIVNFVGEVSGCSKPYTGWEEGGPHQFLEFLVSCPPSSCEGFAEEFVALAHSPPKIDDHARRSTRHRRPDLPLAAHRRHRANIPRTRSWRTPTWRRAPTWSRSRFDG